MARYNAGLIPAVPTVVSGEAAFGTHVNPFISAVMSGNSGSAKPDSAEAGLIYSKTITGGYEVTLVTGASTEVSLGEVITADGQYRVTIDMMDDALVSSGRGVPTGSIIMHAANTAPDGFFKANGAAVSRTTYSELFAEIGTTWGAGNGSTTFNLPDLRGYFLRGWDDGRALDSGRAFGSTQNWAIERIQGLGGGVRDTFTDGLTGPFEGLGTKAEFVSGDRIMTQLKFDSANVVNSASETRPMNIACLFCIKY